MKTFQERRLERIVRERRLKVQALDVEERREIERAELAKKAEEAKERREIERLKTESEAEVLRVEAAKADEERRALAVREGEQTILDRWFDGYKFKNPEVEESCKNLLIGLYKESYARLTSPLLGWQRYEGNCFFLQKFKSGHYADGPWNSFLDIAEDRDCATQQNVTMMQILQKEADLDDSVLSEMLSDEFLEGPVRRAFHELYEGVYLDSTSQDKGRTIEQTKCLLQMMCTLDYKAGREKFQRVSGKKPEKNWTVQEPENQ